MAVEITLSDRKAAELYATLKFELDDMDLDGEKAKLFRLLMKKLDKELAKEVKESVFEKHVSEALEENPWLELPGSGKAFLTLEKALKSGKKVLMKYYSMTSGLTKREVSPIKLDSRYLTAFCHLRNEERTFRLGRIINARILKKSVLHEKEKPKH